MQRHHRAWASQPTASHPLVAGARCSRSLLRDRHRRPRPAPRQPEPSATSKPSPGTTQASRTGSASIWPRGVSGYDFVLIDCPPSLGPLTQTALASSTEVLMPIQCEYFAMEGLAQMIEVIREVMATEREPAAVRRHRADHVRPVAGTDATKSTPRCGISSARSSTRPSFPRDVAVAEAPSHGNSVIDYAPRSRAAPRATSNFAWRCSNVTKEKRLGRGLEALLGRLATNPPVGQTPGTPPGSIRPQPR